MDDNCSIVIELAAGKIASSTSVTYNKRFIKDGYLFGFTTILFVLRMNLTSLFQFQCNTNNNIGWEFVNSHFDF